MLRLPDLGASRAHLDGRSYWRVWTKARAICEWEGRDWADLDQRGIVRADLLCPNLRVAVLDVAMLRAMTPRAQGADLAGRLFQFKGGVRMAHPELQHRTDYQALGMLTSADGNAVLFAWEHGQRRLVGPLAVRIEGNRLIGYGGPETGALRLDHLGVRGG